MADELIRLDTTIIGIDRLIVKASTVEEAKVLFTAKDVIYSQQRHSLDVQPMSMVTGNWEEISDYGGWGDTHYRCSVCGEEWYLEDGTPKDNNMNFCPRCGAKMIKDGDTE